MACRSDPPLQSLAHYHLLRSPRTWSVHKVMLKHFRFCFSIVWLCVGTGRRLSSVVVYIFSIVACVSSLVFFSNLPQPRTLYLKRQPAALFRQRPGWQNCPSLPLAIVPFHLKALPTNGSSPPNFNQDPQLKALKPFDLRGCWSTKENNRKHNFKNWTKRCIEGFWS